MQQTITTQEPTIVGADDGVVYPAAALRRARMLIADGWARKALAMDKRGRVTDCKGARARGFSLLGALVRTSNNIDEFAAAWAALQREVPRGVSPEDWQDEEGRTVSEVLRLLERAAAHFDRGPAQ